MKKILLLAFAALSINAHAQYNLDWSQSQSLSGGTYKSSPVSFFSTELELFTASNDFFEPSGNWIKGVITKYDTDGNLQWSTVLSPAVSVLDFPEGGYGIANWPGRMTTLVVAYNTNSLTSHLIKINSDGTIALNKVMSGMNNIVTIVTQSSDYTYVFGRTPKGNCGGYPCNGIAIAKFDADGQHLWTRTMYTSNLRTRPTNMVKDAAGNIYVCGKKATNLSSNNYDQTFVLKYAPDGTFLWQKEFNASTTETSKQDFIIDDSDYIYFFYADGHAIKLRKLSGANGAVQWTKSIYNQEYYGIVVKVDVTLTPPPDLQILATSKGMRAYNSSGDMVWSNNLINVVKETSSTPDIGADEYQVIAKSLGLYQDTIYGLHQLDPAYTSNTDLVKNLSFGNHECYQGDYCEVWAGDVDADGIYILINDNVPPYCTRVTKISPCDAFTYSFSASATATDVGGGNCNDGQVNVSWTGTFNSWAHIELWKGSSIIESQDYSDLVTSEIYQNLTSGDYTIKVFDESCGEQSFNVTVRCPTPTGLSTTNITRNKARLNWTLPSCNDGVQLQYRLQGAVNWTIVNTTASYKQINGLTPNSLYEWRAASKCSGSNPAVYSDFSAVQTFSTPAQRISVEELSENDELPEVINIYPNPSTQKISFSLNSFEGDVQLQIVNVLGQQVIIKQVQLKGEEIYTIDISSLAQGSYQLILSNDSSMSSITFVKE